MTGVRKLGSKPWGSMVGKGRFSIYDGEGFEPVPSYTTDLNAMHEAEKYFDGKPVDLRSLWVDNLAVCGDWPETKNALELKFEVSYAMQRLTAAQRAEAFLRTIGKWQD